LNAETFRGFPVARRKEALNSLSDKEKVDLFYDWTFWARPNQLPPDQWGKDGCYIWYLRAGRGFGKTRTSAETFRMLIESGEYKDTSLCGATAEEVRDIMINGESGIMKCCHPDRRPNYQPSIKKLFWPNGAITSIFYGSEPEKSRGGQHSLLWADEIHKWQNPRQTWDNLLLGLRLGSNPLAMITSTPKPTSFCRELEALKTRDGRPAVVVTVGSTYENKSNLAPSFFDTIIAQYEGTRLGAQELYAQILDDNPNALFKREILMRDMVDAAPDPANIHRVIVAVDPAASANEKSNHTGIIVLAEGKAPEAVAAGQVQIYIYADLSRIALPHEWGAAAKMAVEQYEAGRVLYESNQGGDMVKMVLKDAGITVPIDSVRAVSDKETRAMPASQASNQGRIHLVRGNDFSALVDELTNWIPGEDSPDRLDAFVHGINYFEKTTSTTSSFYNNPKVLARIKAQKEERLHKQRLAEWIRTGQPYS
jgi:phage terminase large subunit-like protein